MKRNIFSLLIMLLALTFAASAGSIGGKVSGVSGESVVYVDTIQGETFAAPSEHAVIDQKGLLFQPHMTVIQAGTTVDFLNSDKVAHNVFWPSLQQDAKKLPGKNLGTWPQGEKRSFKFDQPGVAALLCNVHPQMSGYVVVSPTPYYALTDKSGNFKIENVPDGQYSVVAWHEGAKSRSTVVAMAGDIETNFTFQNPATQESADKTSTGTQTESAEPAKSSTPGASVELNEGQTPEEVQKALGKPTDTMTLKGSLIYIYPTVKVIFENGKLVDVQYQQK